MHAKTLLIVALAGLHMTAALPVFPSTDDKVDMAKGALQGANMVPSGYESTAKSFGRSYVAPQPEDLKSLPETEKNKLQGSPVTVADTVAPRDLPLSQTGSSIVGGSVTQGVTGVIDEASAPITETLTPATEIQAEAEAVVEKMKTAAPKGRLIAGDFGTSTVDKTLGTAKGTVDNALNGL